MANPSTASPLTGPGDPRRMPGATAPGGGWMPSAPGAGAAPQPAAPASEPPPLQQLLQQRAMAGTVRTAPTTLGAALALVAAVGLALWGADGQAVAGPAWTALSAAWLLLRVGHGLRLRWRPDPMAAPQWVPQYLGGAAVSTLLWMALPWLLFDGLSSDARGLGVFAVVAAAFAEGLALRAMSRIAIALSVSALVPTALWLLVHGGGSAWPWAAAVAAALSVQVATAVSRDRGLRALLNAERELHRLSRQEAQQAERLVRLEFELGRASTQLSSLESRADAEIRRLRSQLDLGQDQRAIDLERRSVDLARQAVTDPLTMLPNRKGINEQLVQLLEPMRRDGEQRGELALLFLDLDEFKQVNDQHGHLAGDGVLKVVAERLREALPRAGFAARWGGDEFIVVLPGLGRIEQVRMVAEKLRAELCLPIRLEGGTVRVGCSVGIALAPYHGRSPETLIINADHAVYAAKTEGRDRVRVFDVALAKKAQRQHQIAQALPGALEKNQLTIVYQPIVEAASGTATHVEALARWPHATWGAVSPGEFIPLAEQNGQIHAMGRWVLRQACLDAARWPGHRPPKVSVNVSAAQVNSGHLVSQVREALGASRLPAARLVIELTESLKMGEGETVTRTLDALSDMGVSLALDDFGTGYSSLKSLAAHPVSLLKIDQSFVRDLRGRGRPIVKLAVDAARNFDMKVVAEGVETAEQRAELEQLGVQYMQGYLFGRPMPADELRAWLALRDDGTEPFVLRA